LHRITGVVLAIIVGLQLAAQSNVERQIFDVENRLLEALKNGTAAGKQTLLSDDFFQIGANGIVANRARIIVSSAEPSLKVLDLNVQSFGDTALTTGIQDSGQRVRFLHVWQRENGKWINVLAHDTPIANVPRTLPTSNAKPAPTSWPFGKTADERAVIEVQRALNESFAKRDLETYSRLTADTFVRITPDGQITDRSAFLETVTSGTDIRNDPNHSEFRIRLYGQMATVSYFNQAADDQRVTRVLVKQHGRWKQLITQATSLREGDGSR
jgi:hypothetical protein